MKTEDIITKEMKYKQDQDQIADLGFETQLSSTRNYPETFVTLDQLEKERRMNIKILEDC